MQLAMNASPASRRRASVACCNRSKQKSLISLGAAEAGVGVPDYSICAGICVLMLRQELLASLRPSRKARVGEMSYEASNGTGSTAPTASAMPTGYRVGVVPGAIEVSARLGTAAAVRDLI